MLLSITAHEAIRKYPDRHSSRVYASYAPGKILQANRFRSSIDQPSSPKTVVHNDRRGAIALIRLRLAEQMSEYSFREGRRVEWREVAEATGIHRATLSKMVTTIGYNATIGNIDRLCRFFRCAPGDLLQYVPDEEAPAAVKASSKGARAGSAAAKAGAAARHARKKA
jgi:putative transcriptional regulator